MKKITKRIMALMLSLVMILGCMPSFINEASANEESDWSKLSRAMSEDFAATIDGVFTVDNDEDNDVRTIKLLTDITAEEDDNALKARLVDTKIVLDLHGHILNRGLVRADGTLINKSLGSVIDAERPNELNSGTVILEIQDSDSTKENKGTIDENGLWHPNPSGEVVLKGGVITGGTGDFNDTSCYGGGIKLSSNTQFTMNGGNICGNIANTGTSKGAGGGLYSTGAEVYLNNCNISYNRTNQYGGGIYLKSSSKLEMKDGVISYNISDGSNGAGGLFSASSTAEIDGCTIIGNESSSLAGGLFSQKNLTLKGKVIIKDNFNNGAKETSAQNLVTAETITVGGLTDGSEIYASYFTSSKQGKGVLTSGYKTNNASAGLNDFFHYDGPDDFFMALNESGDHVGELEIFDVLEDMKIYIVSEHGEVTTNLSHSYAENGTPVTLIVTPDSYYELETLEVKDSEGTIIPLDNNSFTKGDKAVTITATYKELPRPSSSSKSYKAKDENKTAEKVSGSGKKGSTRTITPIEGKKVSSVIVKDKDGNKVDVTLNEDGTYSFKQPASDVTIEVSYKNREITLNIGSTEAEVDGEKSNLDVCPVVRNDRTMLPIRYVAENLGAKVEWNEKKPDYVAITRGDTKIEITLGSNIMLVNGKEVKLDSVAFAENDRTYLPVRAISEALNAIVEWNEERPMEVKIYER